jgi:hypothetical protein
MIKTEFSLGQRLAGVIAKLFDVSVQFFVQLIHLLAAFFVLPNLLGDFVDLLQDFALLRIFQCRYPCECPSPKTKPPFSNRTAAQLTRQSCRSAAQAGQYPDVASCCAASSLLDRNEYGLRGTQCGTGFTCLLRG